MGDYHYYAPQTEMNNTLSGNMNGPDGVLEKRMKILSAYQRLGSEINERKAIREKNIQIRNRIRPIDRFKYHKEGKFSHSSTALIGGLGKKPELDHSNWWSKGVSKAGESMNSAQKRVSEVSAFTGSIVHTNRLNNSPEKLRDEDIDELASSGRLFGSKAFKFIDKSSVDRSQINCSIARQEDFLAEATFRQSLRK